MKYFIIEQELRQASDLLRATSVIFMTAIFCLSANFVMAAQSTQTRWQAHSDLQQAAKRMIENHFDDTYELEISFTRLDKRLRLEKCQQTLDAYVTGNKAPAGATNIAVRCSKPAWKVRIPARVRAYTSVLVAQKPIAKGSIIHSSDVTKEKHDIGKYFAGVFTDKINLTGMVAKRSIRQNAVITPRMVKPKRLVSRGEMVTILAETDGLTIRTSGKALMHGHRGQLISVENINSGRKISGEVIARSTVRVKM